MEFSVFPLFSPQALIAEGSANYGIDLAFSDAERIDLEREVLFPLAGLDPSEAKKYYPRFPILLGRYPRVWVNGYHSRSIVHFQAQ